MWTEFPFGKMKKVWRRMGGAPHDNANVPDATELDT